MVGIREEHDVPQFSRAAEQTTELRGECARSIVDVLDAVSMARDQTRNSLVNEILGAWAEKVLHESMMVQRVVGSNPKLKDATGGARQ